MAVLHVLKMRVEANLVNVIEVIDPLKPTSSPLTSKALAVQGAARNNVTNAIFILAVMLNTFLVKSLSKQPT